MIEPETGGTHRSPPISRLIASDCFPFEFVSEIAEIESWRKEVYRPIYHVHKWWAKRLGSVFRAIVLGSALPETEDLPAAFYQQHDFRDLTVFDPFMGSGTTLGEAYKLGCTALGRDINPVACESVRVAFGTLDRDRLMNAFGCLSAGVGERIRKLYETTDANGDACDTLYFFWVKILPCPSCAASVDLFSSYIFARNAYPERKPEIRVYCPHCSGIFASDVSVTETQCPHCHFSFKPREAAANGASATCGTCQHKFAIAKAVKAAGRPPSHRLFAKLVLTTSGEKQYLPISADDIIGYENCSRQLSRSDLPLPTLQLEDGYNTRQAINYGYTSWRQFFNDRQLLALGWLRQAIAELPEDAERDAMRAVFSGALEFNNMFASYKGEGTGAIRHMFSHHILKPERVPIEGNVWGTSKSSGAFSTLFRSRLMRAIEYRAAPFEVGRPSKANTGTRKVYGCSPAIEGPANISWPPGKNVRHAIHVSCGDSARTGLSEASVDLVITDPPFFDNVHYSELADFFYAWQQLGTTSLSNDRGTTRHPQEVQDVTAKYFAEKLGSVFSECRRVLRDQGLLVFTYQHSRADGWLALADAIVKSNFSVLNCHPVKSDMAVATPKSQAKQPIQIDAILVCCKRSADTRPRQEADEALAAAIRKARAKARRMRLSGRSLSQADERVLMFGQFLAEASTTNDLASALRAHLTALEEAAAQTPAKYDTEDIAVDETQLALLDEPGEYRVANVGSSST
jgi:putative DNA methylase